MYMAVSHSSNGNERLNNNRCQILILILPGNNDDDDKGDGEYPDEGEVDEGDVFPSLSRDGILDVVVVVLTWRVETLNQQNLKLSRR